jgi:predicted RNase H-like nuclease (RuvC/YqgF family)
LLWYHSDTQVEELTTRLGEAEQGRREAHRALEMRITEVTEVMAEAEGLKAAVVRAQEACVRAERERDEAAQAREQWVTDLRNQLDAEGQRAAALERELRGLRGVCVAVCVCVLAGGEKLARKSQCCED